MKLSNRLNKFPAYFFAGVNKKIKAYEEKTGDKVINLGIGSPDLPPEESVISELIEQSRKESTHKYAGYAGLLELKEGIAEYYKNRFNVEINGETEVLPLIGSKEGLANLHFAVIDEGDEVLIPDPGYSVYTTGPLMAGGVPVRYDLKEEHNFLPNIAQLEELVSDKTKMIWLNYPNNPTGAVADLDDFQVILDFAEKYDLIIAHDNPYADITFDGYKAPSFLELKGAKDRTIEFNSFSKTWNMAGWRVGMAVGNQESISALLKIKSNIDTGIFLPLQIAAIKALQLPQSWIDERNKVYEKRRDIVVKMAEGIGLKPIVPKSALYVWCKSDSDDVESLSYEILEKTGVFITPGVAFGKNGEGYFRISLCQPEEILERASKKLSTLNE
ncbi:aminotransferase class I/II-fold pyridoxal phosphate-dependent enzyme [Candidatus Dojkabacteria bacterium]|uniref:Aminotransferase n=1 Tax=Candidatus Dojkabacteria bacterium TaxID=2099670 RepID=A0A955L9K4_9BACT|nr:aminotransferase class I/II-fold pyridoxal phosphate-dependent enzyme [Candidatus Dojkabacteria bacterium]